MSLVKYKSNHHVAHRKAGHAIMPYARAAYSLATNPSVLNVARHVYKAGSHLMSRKKTPVSAAKNFSPQEVGQLTGASNRSASVRTFKKKGVRQKVAKIVHPTKTFKAMVAACEKADDVTGVYHTRCWDRIILDTTGNAQGIGYLQAPQAGSIHIENPWMFNATFFIDAASVLWNNKTPSPLRTGQEPYTSAGSLTVQGAAGANADAPPLKFKVLKSYEVYTIRNNTAKTIKLKIYLCAPKRVSSSTATPFDTITGATTPLVDAIITPDSVWAASMIDDSNQKVNIKSGGAGAIPQTLGVSPTSFREFNRQFKCELQEVIMEPGMLHEYRVEGPNNLEFDSADNLVNGVFYDIQKYSRFPLFVTELDIGGTTLGFIGRAAETNTVLATGLGLLMERQVFLKLKMPAETGFATGLFADYPQQQTLRRDAYFYHAWNAAITGTPNRIDMENPVTTENL